MILITGGLGFVGSHIALHLLQRGQAIVLVDNLVNSQSTNLDYLQHISGQYIPFAHLDIRNTPALNKFVEQYPIDAVVHCAGFKSLPESTLKPIEYYNNNLNVLISLIRVMQRMGCRSLVHISSAAVYGQSESNLDEDMGLNHQSLNPYIQTQQMMEQILKDVALSDEDWNISVLRVSNILGAFEQSIWGEWVPKLPKTILGLLMQAAYGERDYIELYQNAKTADQTVERDFIHIMDVCLAIEKALHWQYQRGQGLDTFNIGSQTQTSIKNLIATVEDVTQTSIATEQSSLLFTPLDRVGIITDKAQSTLGWSPKKSLEQMIADEWTFYKAVKQNKR
ncbi:NAD-dependent epimerase/dehydratase family protein [Acinetobacter sp. MD2(2019)]|uniref:NAD-dependent epimerase/dehydratase family protein n=1 Tax=Acinetobacter sp. MD2(2019) TaxID=2605273 RepID=UPI002D1F12C9|nr:NAD-dependent epimerase/dehydratase family protein [Acinetobacter sp. MD2(2019)]MEB3753850.1 NAD-dependent epimerase/dehydratase family protein [Acinetobacter sp. MD2(2019)]